MVAFPLGASGMGRSPLHRVALVVVLATLVVVAVVASPTRRDAMKRDGVGGRLTVRLTGDQGLRAYRFEGAAGTAIDARAAVFTLSNSRNAVPSAALPCDAGPLAINRYPVTIGGTARVALVGGLVRGRVPQGADWRASYCNSAAILFRQAPDGMIDGVRIDGAWDAVRASQGASRLTLRGSWISNVRDDLFEDDYLYPAAIHDTLVDGAFQGLSIKPGSGSAKGEVSRAVVEMSGLLIRLGEYPYNGKMRFGALTKNGPRSPRLSVRDSMIAIDYRGGGTFADYWRRTWDGLAGSSGNVFLWLSDAAIPPDFPLPPPSFAIAKGAAAREMWRAARSNWINCHANVARLPADPRPIASACRADRWGGQGR